jgi:putative addiction module killer protein
MKSVIEIRHYISRAGKDVFDDWLSELGDARAQAKIASRINRLAAGNLGDCKPLRQVRAADRLGTGLPRLLRDAGKGMRIASLRRRQTKTVVRY